MLEYVNFTNLLSFSFIRSKSLGDIAENSVSEILSKLGTVSKNNDIGHDLKVEGDLNFTVEVKYDMYANKSGNIAVEYHNTKKDKPSGIRASLADFWVYYLNKDEIYLISLDKLKSYTETNTPYKNIIAGGDKNANIYLYKKSDIVKEFINLAEISEEETRRIFQQYCCKDR